MSHFRDHVAASAHRQTASPFFDKLPAEIRQKIYDELWDLHQTRWHVDDHKGHAAPVFPCVTACDQEDLRYKKFQAARGDEAAVWEDRLRSPWNTHWMCAEATITAPSRRQRRMVSPTDHTRILLHLIAPLLVCKRMYSECVETLDNSLTFCFTDIIVARNFIAKHAPTKIIRNINISLRLKPLFTELYFPGPDGEPQPHIGGLPVTAKDNPWEDLCRRLAALTDLRQLHVRLDSEDLRAWHKRVNEIKFCETLFQVTARNYVLDLPTIPDDPLLQGLPGCYLENENLDKAPFQLVRGSRPNNWQLHLSRVSLLLIDRRPH